MNSKLQPPKDAVTTIRRVLVIAVMLDVTFWTAWFIEPRLISDDTSTAFVHYENTFPLGHLLVLITVGFSYFALRNPRLAPTALISLPAAAGAKGYITGVDVLYNVQHNLYFAGQPYYIVLRLTLNVLTLGFTLIALRWTWSQRHQLVYGDRRMESIGAEPVCASDEQSVEASTRGSH